MIIKAKCKFWDMNFTADAETDENIWANEMSIREIARNAIVMEFIKSLEIEILEVE